MAKDMTTAVVMRIPLCDFPHEHIPADAVYDASTTDGPWAFMCQFHYERHHRGGLGLGKGQKLVLPSP